MKSKHWQLATVLPWRMIALPIPLSLMLSACSVVGPATIEAARVPYNEALQNTTNQQSLLNILRVSEGEAPLFVDITEVDAGYSLSQTASGGPSGIGGALAGAITGGVTYSDAPTVRYLPVSGAALIAQLSTPITPEKVSNLIDSEWSVAAVFMFIVGNLTPNSTDYDAALNVILALEQYGAIGISSVQMYQEGRDNKDKDSSKTSNLALILKTRNVSAKAFFCNFPRERSSSDASELRRKASENVLKLWGRLQNIYGQTGNTIIIGQRAERLSIDKGMSLQPQILHTRSALGVLKAAAEQDNAPTIAISTPEKAAQIRSSEGRYCSGGAFYVRTELSAVPEREMTYNSKPVENIDQYLAAGGSSLIAHPNVSKPTPAELRDEIQLANRRVFILITKSKIKPNESYVSTFYKGDWYYIDDKDITSKRNFSLLSIIDTIQAIPTGADTLTRSIIVGAPR